MWLAFKQLEVASACEKSSELNCHVVSPLHSNTLFDTHTRNLHFCPRPNLPVPIRGDLAISDDFAVPVPALASTSFVEIG